MNLSRAILLVIWLTILACSPTLQGLGDKSINIPILSWDLTRGYVQETQQTTMLRLGYSRYILDSGFIGADRIYDSFSGLKEAYAIEGKGPGTGAPPYVFAKLTAVGGSSLRLNVTIPMSVNRAREIMGWFQ
jgi:hypothetical protein